MNDFRQRINQEKVTLKNNVQHLREKLNTIFNKLKEQTRQNSEKSIQQLKKNFKKLSILRTKEEEKVVINTLDELKLRIRS